MSQVKAYATQAATKPLEECQIERRALGSQDIHIEILYCGICHSDIHTARNEWKNTTYPCVPGHEIVGKVIEVGQDVKTFKKGDLAAVGCLVGSCQQCPECKDHQEQFCRSMTFTYNSPEIQTGKMTYGGYSTDIIVDQKFVLHIPKQFKEKDLASVAPLLCAGITTYGPFKHWHVTKGQKVGVIGLGGLGHMAIKIAHALGAHVVLFTTSPHKKADAERLGANEVVYSKDPEQFKSHFGTFDFILNTVSAPLNLDLYLELLKRDGTLCLVGFPGEAHQPSNFGGLLFKRRQLAGSLIGGLKETQEMLDFCAQHGITSDVEVIPIQDVNKAYERVLKSDVKYRFVIDLASLKKIGKKTV